ncbi:MAG TPA: deoxyribonuclease IV [Candidatus Babeliales bacterium]|jgi:deoxyribonuclease-4|nr:deoxyribonuclease IV [Candidatus Babeliales bacterium]
MMKNRVGVHIRMRSRLHELLERAHALDLPFFQCFFVPQETGKLIQVTDDDVREFIKVRRAQFANLYCHASYWVNLSSLGNNGYPQLRREIIFARRLEFTHLVLHAGTAKGAIDKIEGIDALARSLNNLFRQERDINVLLENTCHSNLAVGSDIFDFQQLLAKLNRPERIGFCIDTAHAYSFGYDVATPEGQAAFIIFLNATVGIERIKLIHLNDTVEKLGSFIDRHGVVGQGNIGEDALKNFAQHPALQHIPLLMELPELSVEQELSVLNKVRGW